MRAVCVRSTLEHVCVEEGEYSILPSVVEARRMEVVARRVSKTRPAFRAP